jgi:RNA polymerase sigma factor (sigma-70 family)
MFSRPDELFLRELDTIEQAIGFACRRGKLFGPDAEDFGSIVKLKLIENDYAVLGKFEGRCSFRMFILVVVQRLLLDHRNHLLGKWRPSAQAKRLGETAIRVERLLHRDRLRLDDVVDLLMRDNAGLDRQRVVALAASLPRRQERAREVPEEELELTAAPEYADGPLQERERERMEAEVSACIRSAIAELPAEERLVFRMRFEHGMSVAQIARALQLDQKPIYRQLTRRLRELRRRLERSGLDVHVVSELTNGSKFNLDLGFGPELAASRATPELDISGGEGDPRG